MQAAEKIHALKKSTVSRGMGFYTYITWLSTDHKLNP